MDLNEAEKKAKEFFIRLICDGTKYSCEDMLNLDLPEWFDPIKLKRGQDYIQNNLYLVMNSLATGVIAVFSDVRSLTILDSTGKSSTPQTAKLRYASTILHFLEWFKNDLAPGSSALKSLDNVRKAHVVNSKAAKLKGIGDLKQFELVLTGFGFCGFHYLRPDLTGTYFYNNEDIEGFFHLWAVLIRMVGVKDEYNFCLLPLDVLEIVGRMLIRYILIPNIQMEYPIFHKMVKAITGGLGEFDKAYTFEGQMFLVKMLIGVPGYQYSANFDNEILSPTKLLNEEDINKMNEELKIHMGDNYLPITKHIPIYEDDPENTGKKRIAKYINYEEEWQNNLGHEEFYKLSLSTKNVIRLKIIFKFIYQFSIGRYFLEMLMEKGYTEMKKFKEESQKKKL